VSTINFQELTKADKPLFDRYFRSNYHENSHFNFTNFYMWREPYNVRWIEKDDILFVLANLDGQPMALQPFGAPERMEEATARLVQHFKETGETLFISDIEESYAEVLRNFPGDIFRLEDDRDNYDYVYESEKLISLAGRKLHSKKNHLNAFRKAHPDAEYVPITKDIVDACLKELDAWYAVRSATLGDDPWIADERRATEEVLRDFDFYQLKGGAIRLDGRVIAFTFGEQLNTDTAVVHVEKADPNIRGAYPAINQGYVSHEWSHLPLINREEDMGLEGLRKAKESYKPVKLIKKYNAWLK